MDGGFQIKPTVRKSFEVLISLFKRRFKRVVPNSFYLKLWHYECHQLWPNINHPATFSEKILLRKLNPRPVFTMLSDKYRVRDYVEHNIGASYLPKLYHVCEDLDYRSFSKLPRAFVMKSNRGSGLNLIVRDKSAHTFPELFDLAYEWRNINKGVDAKEAHYSEIKPLTIFEEFITDDNEGSVPKDYKFHCFRKDGVERIFIQVDSDRFENHTRLMYDLEWNELDFEIEKPKSPFKLEKPPNLGKMIEVARTLSAGFHYVRVDLYSVDNDIKFSELTFTPTGGLGVFRPVSIDAEWGGFFYK